MQKMAEYRMLIFEGRGHESPAVTCSDAFARQLINKPRIYELDQPYFAKTDEELANLF